MLEISRFGWGPPFPTIFGSAIFVRCNFFYEEIYPRQIDGVGRAADLNDLDR